MNWLPWDQARGLIELPPRFNEQTIRRVHIDAAIAALRRWYPDITFGVNSCFLREDFYHERVCLDGAIDKDVIVLTLWHGDELVGLWSGEREVDSLALWGRLVVIAPEHARIGLTRETIAGMEEAGRRMGAAFIFIYALITLKHPYMQQGLEQAGYRLLGFFPGYDRELVAPGVVKRVYQAVYAKLLAPENKVLRPDPKNMTPRTKSCTSSCSRIESNSATPRARSRLRQRHGRTSAGWSAGRTYHQTNSGRGGAEHAIADCTRILNAKGI
jgi:hypothetical protein